mmetsp:Transcript_13822/g.29979  ORF Transcript_13822/g.29979 Transcript_13822/m.29979 type:complete len:105 (+) Transcript_13822:96-410(+)
MGVVKGVSVSVVPRVGAGSASAVVAKELVMGKVVAMGRSLGEWRRRGTGGGGAGKAGGGRGFGLEGDGVNGGGVVRGGGVCRGGLDRCHGNTVGSKSSKGGSTS